MILQQKSQNSKLEMLLCPLEELRFTHKATLANASFFAEPGTILEFKVKRDDKEIIVPLKVTIRPKNQKTTGIAINTNI